jgi:hypothetical protein
VLCRVVRCIAYFKPFRALQLLHIDCHAAQVEGKLEPTLFSLQVDHDAI